MEDTKIRYGITPRLTDEQTRVLAAIACGATSELAARQLNVSARTIRRRVRDACYRLDVDTTIEAVVWAAKYNLI